MVNLYKINNLNNRIKLKKKKKKKKIENYKKNWNSKF